MPIKTDAEKEAERLEALAASKEQVTYKCGCKAVGLIGRTPKHCIAHGKSGEDDVVEKQTPAVPAVEPEQPKETEEHAS